MGVLIVLVVIALFVIVLLARTLWREGYNDHLAGHITYNLGDGTLLCNPWMLLWNEIRPADIIRIDLDGNVVEGDWPVPPGIPLHLELHKMRPGVHWAMRMVLPGRWIAAATFTCP